MAYQGGEGEVVGGGAGELEGVAFPAHVRGTRPGALAVGVEDVEAVVLLVGGRGGADAGLGAEGVIGVGGEGEGDAVGGAGGPAAQVGEGGGDGTGSGAVEVDAGLVVGLSERVKTV